MAFVELASTADSCLLPTLCWGIGNIAVRWDSFTYQVDAPALLKVLVDKLDEENSSEETFQLIVGDAVYALRSIVRHPFTYECILSTLLLFIKFIKNWQKYPKRVVYNALSGIRQISIHNNERVIGLLLCHDEWECIKQMVIFFDHEKTGSPNTNEEFSCIISDALYYQSDSEKTALLVESNLLDVFFVIFKTNPEVNVKFNICRTISNLCVDLQCRTILSHTDLIRTLLEIFPTVQRVPTREDICFIFNKCLDDEELTREFSNSLVECGLLDFFCQVIQRKISGNLLEQALQCLARVLHVGEFIVDNESILFNEYVLKFGEKGGRELLLDVVSNDNELHSELSVSVASGIVTSFFGSKYEEFSARKRGFKIKKAL